LSHTGANLNRKELRVKINFVCVEDSLIAVGYRKMAAVMKSVNPDTNLFYVRPSRRSFLNRITSKQQERNFETWVSDIAREIAGADIVAFSSMSDYSELVAAIIGEVKRINPGAFVVWGGCHPIIAPQDAIASHTDAICAGEGEHAFPELLDRLKRGQDYADVRNFWFNRDGEVIANPFRPLSTNRQLTELPLLDYASPGENIFHPGKGFVEMTKKHYLRCSGLGYTTVWSIGCPFRCSYCGNSKFIENDPLYRQLRHPSADYIISEIQQAVDRHPHISSIVFQDDSFMALDKPLLEEFAKKYKSRIDLPFAVAGLVPNCVQDDKFRILLAAGMDRVRMGIQSGSRKILDFYRRPSQPDTIIRATSIIGEYRRYMIPPAYDIIVDNPIETKQDIKDTLRMVYDLPRPFTLNLFSLRVMPNTELADQFEQLGIDRDAYDMASVGYHTLEPTFANAMLYLLCIIKPPRFLFERWLEKCKPSADQQKNHRLLNLQLRIGWLVRRGLGHLKRMDFALIPGRLGYFLWKIGFISFWRRRINRKYTPEPAHRNKTP
jgi:radical SAM superfamily enzyme YgiQ (UPF0313 family)